MTSLEQIKNISRSSPTRIVMFIMDGLGGLPHPETGKTELETAKTPNLDRLARESICGLTDPVGQGITPGSGPAHMSLFGYDPFHHLIGRGVLEALGIDFALQYGDLAARGNFCTIDQKGLVTDRRAGRISTETCTKLCQKLSAIKMEETQLIILPVSGHRFVLILRGENLSAELSESDPQKTGVLPLKVNPLSGKANRTAGLINDFIEKARTILADSHPANMLLLRGFSQHPSLPSMRDIYKLKPAAIAPYPMYRGLAKLVGMEILTTGGSIEEELICLEQHYADYDFFFIHIKGTDAAGEDGDFDRKVRIIEEVDASLPRLFDLKPEVIVVTGDHSTPAILKGHSWHPVPFMLNSQYCRPDDVAEFSERACSKGALGRFPALDVMPLALANALKLTKYGA